MSRQYVTRSEEIYNHASKRMFERCGIIFSKQIERDLILKIKRGEAILDIDKTTKNVYQYMNSKVYRLKYENQIMRVCVGLVNNKLQILTVYR